MGELFSNILSVGLWLGAGRVQKCRIRCGGGAPRASMHPLHCQEAPSLQPGHPTSPGNPNEQKAEATEARRPGPEESWWLPARSRPEAQATPDHNRPQDRLPGQHDHPEDIDATRVEVSGGTFGAPEKLEEVQKARRGSLGTILWQ